MASKIDHDRMIDRPAEMADPRMRTAHEGLLTTAKMETTTIIEVLGPLVTTITTTTAIDHHAIMMTYHMIETEDPLNSTTTTHTHADHRQTQVSLHDRQRQKWSLTTTELHQHTEIETKDHLLVVRPTVQKADVHQQTANHQQ